MGLSLVPAFATVYQRLTLPEPPLHSAARRKYIDRIDLSWNSTSATRELHSEPEEKLETDVNVSSESSPLTHQMYLLMFRYSRRCTETGAHTRYVATLHSQYGSMIRLNIRPEFLEYLSEGDHWKHLTGTCLCWFLTNIACATFSPWCISTYVLLSPRFYGVNLNQNFVLEQIGFQGTTGTPWQKLFKIATGSLIITVLGFIPGTSMFPLMVLY